MAALQCRDCVTGALHTDTPTGIELTIHDIPTYVARPNEGQPEKGLIIYITDIFGWELPNNRLLADRYAKKGGYVVYIPDFLRGRSAQIFISQINSLKYSRIHTLPPGHGASSEGLRFTAAYSAPSSLLYTIFIKPIYLLRAVLTFAGPVFHGRRSKSKPLIFDFMRALRNDPATADLKIGVAGFCWGGQYAVLLAQDDLAPPGSTESKSLVDAAFTAHPALLSIPEDIEKVKAPLSIAVAEHDMYLKPPAVERLMRIEKGEDYEVVMFPGTRHGFAIRNNTKDGVQMAAAEKAEELALTWFKRWLG